jgi:hypothetical protein
MCNLYSITTNQAAIAALFRVAYRYVGNPSPMSVRRHGGCQPKVAQGNFRIADRL